MATFASVAISCGTVVASGTVDAGAPGDAAGADAPSSQASDCNTRGCVVASITLSNPTTTTLDVTWTPPVDTSRGAITGYRLGWTEGGTNRGWDGVYPATTLTVTLTGLVAATSYSVRVTPITAAGDAPVTTRTASTAGGGAASCNTSGCVVASLVLSNPTMTTLDVTWTPPADTSRGAITGYRLGWTEGGTNRSWDGLYPATTRTITLTGLVAATSYSVRVTPVTAAGDAPISTSTGSTTGTTSPPPPQTNKFVAGYWQMFQGPAVSEITASAPQYNLQYAAFAMGNRAGTGSVSFDPVFSSPAQLKSDIAASKAQGSTWLLSVGGGSDDTLQLLNDTNANELVTSVIPIIDNYGFQGVDFDLERGSGQWSPAAMVSAAVKLKTHYGTGFLISAAPRPYEDEYRTFAVQAGSALDLFGYQFYDFPEANDTTFLRNYINSRVDEAVGMGIPASKLMVGCITYSGYQAGHNTVQNYRDIFKEVETRYPALRGVYIWETSLDKLDSWSFAHLMGPSIRGVP